MSKPKYAYGIFKVEKPAGGKWIIIGDAVEKGYELPAMWQRLAGIKEKAKEAGDKAIYEVLPIDGKGNGLLPPGV
mgnify:CR=1 FL=1